MPEAVETLFAVLHTPVHGLLGLLLAGPLGSDAAPWIDAAANHGLLLAEFARPVTKGWSDFV
ncbi:hypothetical protein HFP72_19390 [Nocardiopsis sp. ARC36]